MQIEISTLIPIQKVKVEYSEKGAPPILTSLILTVHDQEQSANYGLFRIDGAFVGCKLRMILFPFHVLCSMDLQ